MTLDVTVFDQATGEEVEGLPPIGDVRCLPRAGDTLTIWTDYADRRKNQAWRYKVLTIRVDWRFFEGKGEAAETVEIGVELLPGETAGGPQFAENL